MNILLSIFTNTFYIRRQKESILLRHSIPKQDLKSYFDTFCLIMSLTTIWIFAIGVTAMNWISN